MSLSSDTNVESILLSDLYEACLDDGSGRYFIEIPKFQRSVVWSEDQQETLIESLFQGFPIGTLLCHNTGKKSGNRDIIQLVDGLQRTTTILSYQAMPLALCPVKYVLDPTDVRALSLLLTGDVNNEVAEDIESQLKHWLRATKTTNAADGFNTRKLGEAFSQIATVEINDDETENLLNNLLDKIRSRITEIEKTKIPLIVYSGPSENIPTIFERVNSQGTSLTKYEIYAASWLDSFTVINNPEVRVAVEGKYRELTERGYVVAGFDESNAIPSDKFNLFEYLFGLGKVLGDTYPFIFPDPGKADESSPLAFVFATVGHGLKLNEMGKLASRLREMHGSQAIDLSAFEQALFRSCDVIQQRLKPYLKLKLNRQSASARFIPHSQNQIISLILSHMIWANNPNSWQSEPTPEAKRLEQNVVRNYLFDLVRETWRGSGDSRLWEMCWGAGFDYARGNFERATYYGNAPDDTKWLAALHNWHDEQLSKKQKERPNVPEKTKAVLKFLYAHIVSVQHDEATEFEIEHLYPVAALTAAISNSESEEGWPISAFGNLALLPKDLNRIKGANTLGDYLYAADTNPRPTKDEIASIQKYVISPNCTEITLAKGLSREDYDKFVQSRFEILARTLLSNI